MNTKLKLLALSASVLAGFAAAPAHAYVYGQSSLLIDALAINISPLSGADITNFTFTNTNTAFLNGAGGATQATCSGADGAPGPGTNNCNASQPRLNPLAMNAPGGDAGATRGNLDFSFKGPAGGLQFSNSASAIDQSTLTGDAFGTWTRQIAESELQTGSSASASSQIQSITGFMFTFTTIAPGSLSLSFSANPDQYSEINELLNGLFSAQSNMSVSFTLQQNGGPQFATWSPSGTAANDCIAVGGLTCSETNDQENLNAPIGTTTNHTIAQASHNGAVFSLFGINISGLTAGTFSLTLAATTSTQLSRTPVPVPEPGVLLLLGTALTALGLSRRRQKQ